MKRIYVIIALFQIFSTELIAQQDSSLITDTAITNGKDSANGVLPISATLDSSYWRTGPGGPWGEYGRPCIIPMKIDTFDLSSLLVQVKSFEIVSLYNEEGAKADIKKGDPRILFPGGFGGMPDFSSKADREFQEKYRVEFFSQGCLRSGEHEDEAGYNQVIFDYLDKKYGMAWRYELREDAIGFKAPSSITEAVPKLASPLALQIANPENSQKTESPNADSETSVWWYVLPTSGFALLLSLYFIKKKKD
ncbi:MAG: hypothetical protein K0S23_844 [Fluviicola sp.]|jgi:hypothetical protein|uniref:FEKKY domain-containing protein n=1 Tax=Fluviicola sp. TaxID=1917219 RepID=UPI002639F55C|nr:hypothetical protein [Fluviicola sp.]MDF3026537.1 hypothetical protein [Fluviicola sp.]